MDVSLIKEASVIFEFCAENFTHVPAAIEAGAQRIELCDNLAQSGTTPSVGVIQRTVEYAHDRAARVMCMIRPRGGDFCMSDDELDIMEMDLCAACGLGVDGVVFGCTRPTADGFRLDTHAVERLISAVREAEDRRDGERIDVTFHMAFDALAPEDQIDAIDYLAEQGVTRILTHGGPAGTDIMENLPRLRDLAEYAGDRLIILPGAGISYVNRDAIARELGCPELHGTKIVKLEA